MDTIRTTFDEPRGRWHVVKITGEIDVYTSPMMREDVLAQVDAIPGEPYIILVMTDVDFLDSTGLGVLVGILKRVRARNGGLRLVANQERILKIFRIAGLAKVFPIYGDSDDATDN